MNKNFIKELNKNLSYLDLRILMYLECEKKMKMITRILNFLHANDFLVNLSMIYYNAIRAENTYEHQDIPSLTIDMRDNNVRFKYWDGSKTYWTYHTDDLFKILIDGRNEFSALVDKYAPITELLQNIKSENEKEISMIRYTYYPKGNLDISYEIQFTNYVKEHGLADGILKDIFHKINDLELEDLKMDIDYSFLRECIPCQKAKENKE